MSTALLSIIRPPAVSTCSCLDCDPECACRESGCAAECELQSQVDAFVSELEQDLTKLNCYAKRHDSLAVASVAYRLRNRAEQLGVALVHQGASRIESSARRNSVNQFSSEIDLLELQVRFISQLTHCPR